MIHRVSVCRLVPVLILAAALAGEGCGGGSPAAPGPNPTPTPTPVPTPTPTPTPSATPSPDASAKCEGLADGPVTRIAVTARQQQTDGTITDVRVRARPGFDEVWCLDKDKEHRLDFDLNQRNAEGRACCWDDPPEWDVDDPSGFLSGNGTTRDDNGFIYRIRVNSGGERGSLGVTANLDGVDSHPWQSGSGYQQGTLNLVLMSASDIQKDCHCIFRGNGQYEGDKCPK